MLELTDIYYDALDAPKSGMKVSFSNCVFISWDFKGLGG